MIFSTFFRPSGILSAETLRRLKPVFPFVERGVFNGKSYGLSVCGYDVRCAQNLTLAPGDFVLASTIEQFRMPKDVAGFVKDKSSFARVGLSVFNTFIDPGFFGGLTLELKHLGNKPLEIPRGTPVAQVIFQFTDRPTEGYCGKYQWQTSSPQEAIYEKD
jgi:dCTP deaminase